MNPLNKRLIHSDLTVASNWIGEAITRAESHKTPDDPTDWVTTLRCARAELDAVRADFERRAQVQPDVSAAEQFWTNQVQAELAAEKKRQQEERI